MDFCWMAPMPLHILSHRKFDFTHCNEILYWNASAEIEISTTNWFLNDYGSVDNMSFFRQCLGVDYTPSHNLKQRWPRPMTLCDTKNIINQNWLFFNQETALQLICHVAALLNHVYCKSERHTFPGMHTEFYRCLSLNSEPAMPDDPWVRLN